ncbi:MAG: N-acetyl-gamma-glutamyl-phosphate reductase, partial [Neisseriaceae bacterium]
MIRASIVGASGYTGIELVRILMNHPQVEISYLVSESYHDQELSHVFPHLAKTTVVIKHPHIKFSKIDVDKIAANSDVVFLALPHTASALLAQKFLTHSVKVVDLSADLRLNDGKVYQKWYQHEPAPDKLLEMAVYGLPEINRYQQIQKSNLIANPGCYPTASILAVAPLLMQNLIDNSSTIILDAKSGVSGSGRNLNLGNHYCEVSNSFAAYQIAGIHRHIPEIEQE